MLGEFVRRLLVALPVVCLLAVLAILLLRRSKVLAGQPGGSALWRRLPFAPAATATPVPLLLGVRQITPAARLAVVRFGGRELLLGVSAQSFTLLATDDSGPPAAAGKIRTPAAPGNAELPAEEWP